MFSSVFTVVRYDIEKLCSPVYMAKNSVVNGGNNYCIHLIRERPKMQHCPLDEAVRLGCHLCKKCIARLGKQSAVCSDESLYRTLSILRRRIPRMYEVLGDGVPVTAAFKYRRVIIVNPRDVSLAYEYLKHTGLACLIGVASNSSIPSGVDTIPTQLVRDDPQKRFIFSISRELGYPLGFRRLSNDESVKLFIVVRDVSDQEYCQKVIEYTIATINTICGDSSALLEYEIVLMANCTTLELLNPLECYSELIYDIEGYDSYEEFAGHLLLSTDSRLFFLQHTRTNMNVIDGNLFPLQNFRGQVTCSLGAYLQSSITKELYVLGTGHQLLNVTNAVLCPDGTGEGFQLQYLDSIETQVSQHSSRVFTLRFNLALVYLPNDSAADLFGVDTQRSVADIALSKVTIDNADGNAVESLPHTRNPQGDDLLPDWNVFASSRLPCLVRRDGDYKVVHLRCDGYLGIPLTGEIWARDEQEVLYTAEQLSGPRLHPGDSGTAVYEADGTLHSFVKSVGNPVSGGAVVFLIPACFALLQANKLLGLHDPQSGQLQYVHLTADKFDRRR